jgi:alkylation response protein AidB-like acyl-CoA dehydrogenase
MKVALDSDQEMFATVSAALAAELSERWDPGRERAEAGRPVLAPADLATVVEAGWLAVRLNEEAGGAGGSCVDVCIVAEQLGRHTVPAPVLGTLIALEQLRVHGADPALQESIANGERTVAPVFTADLREFATVADDGARTIAVDTAGVGSGLVVGKSATEHGLGPSATGVDLTRELAPVVGTTSVEHALARGDDAEARDRATAHALALISADLLGVSERALADSVEHAKARHQFGAPIGSFQAVQHLLAECLVSVDVMRSAVWYAAWAVDSLSPAEALRAARTAKAFASQEAVQVTHAAVQTFGGLGMTWESRTHLWQRRVRLDRALLGDENVQYDLLAAA